MTIPSEYGGLDLDRVSYALVFEEIARGWMGVAGVLGSHSLSAWMINQYGTQDQKERYLPDLASGARRTGIALTEPGAGTDLQGIQTRAERDGEHYVVNGAKTWITNARHADPMPVLVKTSDESPAHRGLSMLLVEAGTPGYTVSRDLPKLGYKGTETCEITLQDVRVHSDQLLGGVEGRGMQQALSALELGRVNIAARAVGVSQWRLRRRARLRGPARGVRQAHRRLPGHPAQARRHGHRDPGGQADDVLGGLQVGQGGGRHGQVLRLRGRTQGDDGGHAGARRLRLLAGVRARTALPRRTAHGDRRGHQRRATPGDSKGPAQRSG
ncbi:hypothetical protein GCM10020219_043670 [Nonomuraea dietziae]